MNTQKGKTIGIVGGMGPEAGFALGTSILKNTKASTDQQHLSVILMSFPQYIVDRTAFLAGETEVNPAFEISKIILKLEEAGAEVVGLACNTAHSPKIFDLILKQLQKKQSKVKVLNMPWEACKFVKENHPTIRRIGLMTSNGTYNSKVYKNLLEEWGYEVILPEFEFQNDIIHRLIYDPNIGIKANPGGVGKHAKILLNNALSFFQQNDAEGIIMGCTEIPLILSDTHAQNMLLINPTNVLAKALINEALSPKKIFF